MFGRILAAVDGSEHASRAAETAIDMAKRYSAKLFVIAVAEWRETEMTGDLQRFLDVEHLSKEEFVAAAAVEGILADAEGLAHAGGLHEVELIPRIGRPARRILEFADSAGMDLIVMGTRGRGEIEGLILGSVSHRVVAAAKCSCLLVR